MNTVMIISLVLCAAIAIWGVADPDSMTGAAQWLVNYSLTALDWYFLALCTAILVISSLVNGYLAQNRSESETELSESDSSCELTVYREIVEAAKDLDIQHIVMGAQAVTGGFSARTQLGQSRSPRRLLGYRSPGVTGRRLSSRYRLEV